ncbi:unnamed protein product, partial [Allacma fusca]
MNYNASRNDTRWRTTKPEDVAAIMAGISRDPGRWESEKSVKRTSLWALLSQNLWPRRRVKDFERLWLRSVYIGNRRSVQDLYRELVNEPLVVPTPLASSTPKPKAEKHCVCGEREGRTDESMVECTVCKQWFHGICVDERISTLVDNSSWACPHCRGVFGNMFPDYWKDSLPLRQRVACNMTPVEGSSMQLGRLVETVVEPSVHEKCVEQGNVVTSVSTTAQDLGPSESISSDSESDSDYASIRCSKSRIGIIDSCSSDSENDMQDVQLGNGCSNPETSLHNTRHRDSSSKAVVINSEKYTIEEYTRWELPPVIYVE